MARKQKIFSGKFIIGIVIYAVVFLALAAVGLKVFWDFIEAYEISRPVNTVNAFMDSLSVEQLCEGSDELYASVDQNIQSREQFDQVIRDMVTESLTCAKKSKESTEDRQVYAIRAGKQVVGEFAIAAGKPDKFGFRVWELADSSFDLSYLMGQSVSITVPSEYQVSVNGNVLDETYITKTGIEYSALDGFYDDYDLPVMVTYTADNFLGEADMVAADSEGNVVQITAETDMNTLLPQCSSAETAKVEEFAKEFIRLWVIFSGSANDSVTYNYHMVKKMLSSDGELAYRLYTALEGLTYAQSNSDTIQGLTINRIVPLEGEKYVCDVTYVVRTVGRQGPVDTTSNMKMMLITEAGALKLQSMERY